MNPQLRRPARRGSIDPSSALHLLPILAGVTAVLLACLALAAHLGWIPGPPGLSLGAITSRIDELPPAACGRCGVIEAVREMEAVQGSPFHGGLTGASLGQPLSGMGKDVSNILGLLVIALSSGPSAPRGAPSTLHAIIVRFDDGSGRVLTEIGPPAWKPGDRVKVVSGRILPLAEATFETAAAAAP